jgi:hypothetical protein
MGAYLTTLLKLDLYLNKLNGSSFEKGVFTDPSFANVKIRLFLWENKITYLDEEVFSPFLSKSGNEIATLINNPLDCDDCRSAWICRSTTPERVRKCITDAKCFDGNKYTRDFTDCESNFLKCK